MDFFNDPKFQKRAFLWGILIGSLIMYAIGQYDIKKNYVKKTT
jgi:hypothetical protein